MNSRLSIPASWALRCRPGAGSSYFFKCLVARRRHDGSAEPEGAVDFKKKKPLVAEIHMFVENVDASDNLEHRERWRGGLAVLQFDNLRG